MNQQKVWEDFTALPLEAQHRAADFITFLRSRYRQYAPAQNSGPADLEDEAFIGMWHDRIDMEDSSQWVRDVRSREWK
jgi:hypothetical protein